jgi:hypothetical protein
VGIRALNLQILEEFASSGSRFAVSWEGFVHDRSLDALGGGPRMPLSRALAVLTLALLAAPSGAQLLQDNPAAARRPGGAALLPGVYKLAGSGRRKAKRDVRDSRDCRDKKLRGSPVFLVPVVPAVPYVPSGLQ